jgi:hypothetical protein
MDNKRSVFITRTSWLFGALVAALLLAPVGYCYVDKNRRHRGVGGRRHF